MKTDILGAPRFELGDIAITSGAAEMISEGILVDLYLDRHWRGDWGDICEEDKDANDQAVLDGGRILSSFETPLFDLLIITEADRSRTTVLTPFEY
jgi:hypothetical protein